MLRLLLSLLMFTGLLFCNISCSFAGEHEERKDRREHRREHDDDDDREHEREHRREMPRVSHKQIRKYIKKNFSVYTDDLNNMSEAKTECCRERFGEIRENIAYLIFTSRNQEATADRTVNILNLLSEYFAIKVSQSENKKTAGIYLDKMNSVLERIFNIKAEMHSAHIKNMEKETAELKNILGKRMAAKKEIIETRREQLLSEFNKNKSWDW